MLVMIWLYGLNGFVTRGLNFFLIVYIFFCIQMNEI